MNQKVSGKTDTRYLNLLNVLACLAVVSMHANNCLFRFSATQSYWRSANTIVAVCYFAVPVFFMITGATLMEYSDRYSTWEFFRRRILKTGIPFLVWSVLAVLFSDCVLGKVELSTTGVRYWYDAIVNTSAVSYYWFFTSLFCVYLTMPLLSAVSKEKRKAVFTYLAVAGYLLNALLPFLNALLELELTLPYTLYGVGGDVLFVVVGYLLTHYDFPPKWRRVLYAVSVAAMLVLIFGSYHWSMKAGSVQRLFKDRAISIPYAAGILLFCKTHGARIMASFVGKIVNFLKDYTFPIYLLQWFVIQSLKTFLPIDETSLLWRLGGVVVVVAICVGVTALLRKIPGVRRILP